MIYIYIYTTCTYRFILILWSQTLLLSMFYSRLQINYSIYPVAIIHCKLAKGHMSSHFLPDPHTNKILKSFWLHSVRELFRTMLEFWYVSVILHYDAVQGKLSSVLKVINNKLSALTLHYICNITWKHLFHLSLSKKRRGITTSFIES